MLGKPNLYKTKYAVKAAAAADRPTMALPEAPAVGVEASVVGSGVGVDPDLPEGAMLGSVVLGSGVVVAAHSVASNSTQRKFCKFS